MPTTISIQVLPHEASNDEIIRQQIARFAGIATKSITGYYPIKQSIDARGKQIKINLTLQVFSNEEAQPRTPYTFAWKQVQHASQSVIIVGAGPAGLFAALKLIEAGIRPIVVERGKNVRDRRRDLALLNKNGILNPESNYCFGEGGAGTYSDGKLYTRSNKRGNIERILHLFHQFGADETILYQSHPHIGTNKLPHIITKMREHIEACGGTVHFESKVTDLLIDKERITGVQINGTELLKADAVLLATGHSARDIFELLAAHKIRIEAKPFALGVRIEHPQQLIDSIQYKCPLSQTNQSQRGPYLPPASYSLVEQVLGKGVFSFCMCPGGIIAPASTAANELVVNGWSPSKRNNPFANSGMVVSVEEKDALHYFTTNPLPLGKQKENLPTDPLLMMYFQQSVEQKAYKAGGGNFVAPAQRMVDVFDKKLSGSLPPNSYIPGLQSSDLRTVLPGFIYENLRLAFNAFGNKMKGYFTNEAVVVATESRTSSPVRIPRDPLTLAHPQVKNLFPCGEGAGYAGGIISAAMDGENVAAAITQVLWPASNQADKN
jgi:uncharacterized FAD-dependent dehydrogenase